MNTWKIQSNFSQHFSHAIETESAFLPFKYHISCLKICLGAHAIGGEAFLYFRDKLLYWFIIKAKNSETVKGYTVNKAEENFFY